MIEGENQMQQITTTENLSVINTRKSCAFHAWVKRKQHDNKTCYLVVLLVT